MIVRVEAEGSVLRATVTEPDDLQRLHVEGNGAQIAAIDQALRAAGLGGVNSSGAAELSVRDLQTAAETSARGDDWATRWMAMLGYAKSKGWLSADEQAVTAHIVDASD